MHEFDQTPQFLDVPTSVEAIATPAEADQLLHDTLTVVSNALQQALGEFTADQGDANNKTLVEQTTQGQSEAMIAALNTGTIPPVARINGFRGNEVYHIFSRALTPDTYPAPDGTFQVWEFDSVDPATGEQRHLGIPLGKDLGFDAGYRRTRQEISTPYGWNIGSRGTDMANAAFALATAVRPWQENPRSLPTLDGRAV